MTGGAFFFWDIFAQRRKAIATALATHHGETFEILIELDVR